MSYKWTLGPRSRLVRKHCALTHTMVQARLPSGEKSSTLTSQTSTVEFNYKCLMNRSVKVTGKLDLPQSRSQISALMEVSKAGSLSNTNKIRLVKSILKASGHQKMRTLGWQPGRISHGLNNSKRISNYPSNNSLALIKHRRQL